MTENIENEKIIIDFDKMDKIGNKNVSEINKKILNLFKERNKIIEMRNKGIIDYVLKKGNITLEKEEEIIKRNKGIIDYVVRCDNVIFNNDKQTIKRYKEIIEIRNNGKTDYCLKTDKQMIECYRDIIQIRNDGNRKIWELILTNVSRQFQFSYSQQKEWIKSFIEINGIERLLEIYEDDQHCYDYILDWQKGITHKNSDHWFFDKEVIEMLEQYW